MFEARRGEAIVHLSRVFRRAGGGAGGSANAKAVCHQPRATKSATRPEEPGGEQTKPEHLTQLQGRVSNPNKYPGLCGRNYRSPLLPQFPIARAVAVSRCVGLAFARLHPATTTFGAREMSG